MVERRQLLKAAMFGGFVTRPGTADASAQAIPDRQANEIVDVLKNLSRAIDAANSFTEIAEVRLRQVNFLRAEGRFPDFIDVGSDVWMGVYDWHIKHSIPVPLGRDPGNRHTITLLSTALVLRPDMVPTLIGTPY